jgi:hypothetical protein
MTEIWLVTDTHFYWKTASTPDDVYNEYHVTGDLKYESGRVYVPVAGIRIKADRTYGKIPKHVSMDTFFTTFPLWIRQIAICVWPDPVPDVLELLAFRSFEDVNHRTCTYESAEIAYMEVAYTQPNTPADLAMKIQSIRIESEQKGIADATRFQGEVYHWLLGNSFQFSHLITERDIRDIRESLFAWISKWHVDFIRVSDHAKCMHALFDYAMSLHVPPLRNIGDFTPFTLLPISTVLGELPKLPIVLYAATRVWLHIQPKIVVMLGEVEIPVNDLTMSVEEVIAPYRSPILYDSREKVPMGLHGIVRRTFS